MKMNPLGRTGELVSELCLGTMTFGTQTSETEAHTQIDVALEFGINFLDTAEMYPVNPVSKETIGLTEHIIGAWNKKNKSKRSNFLLATKHSGEGSSYVRNGAPISSETIAKTIEGSLRRLQTDCIDLYQFHWPNRGSYMFRQNWDYDPSSQNRGTTISNFEDCLEALQQQVEKGNIRYFGLSNESAWGTAQWLTLSEKNGWPRVSTLQNEYSLLCRIYDTDLAELSLNEQVGLIAYSPLAAGLLTGKYQDNKIPIGSRRSINRELGGRVTPRVWEAIKAYQNIASKYGIDLIHMSLAWCRTRPFMCSAIFGATKLEQLKHILLSRDVVLTEDCIKEITEAHRLNPMPF